MHLIGLSSQHNRSYHRSGKTSYVGMQALGIGSNNKADDRVARLALTASEPESPQRSWTTECTRQIVSLFSCISFVRLQRPSGCIGDNIRIQIPVAHTSKPVATLGCPSLAVGCISLFSCISFVRLYQPLGCISLLAVSACLVAVGVASDIAGVDSNIRQKLVQTLGVMRERCG